MDEMWVMGVSSMIRGQPVLIVFNISGDTVLTALGIRSMFDILCFDYLP